MAVLVVPFNLPVLQASEEHVALSGVTHPEYLALPLPVTDLYRSLLASLGAELGWGLIKWPQRRMTSLTMSLYGACFVLVSNTQAAVLVCVITRLLFPFSLD